MAAYYQATPKCGRNLKYGKTLCALLPLSAPAIVAVNVFAFTAACNELLFGLIFITSPDLQTVPVAIS